MGHKPIQVVLDEELIKRFKIMLIRQGMTMQGYLESVIRDHVEDWEEGR